MLFMAFVMMMWFVVLFVWGMIGMIIFAFANAIFIKEDDLEKFPRQFMTFILIWITPCYIPVFWLIWVALKAAF